MCVASRAHRSVRRVAMLCFRRTRGFGGVGRWQTIHSFWRISRRTFLRLMTRQSPKRTRAQMRRYP
jgi:hypothetical protein